MHLIESVLDQVKYENCGILLANAPFTKVTIQEEFLILKVLLLFFLLLVSSFLLLLFLVLFFTLGLPRVLKFCGIWHFANEAYLGLVLGPSDPAEVLIVVDLGKFIGDFER